ncbi:Cytochrome P450 [Micromonospora nigra]|uniref:Cytochrome P450 n=1 Tax=Micromonospora nigra TaxID=145857 RepID=A0A1C6RD08_9ACTN|nr:cytochrome P450 [Micromonospora nigra]SCL15037.1 Cytochrome P450 [Micromonospora nigra]
MTLGYPFHRTAPLVTPPEFAQLRAERPVAPAVLPTGSVVYLVTRYDDVKTVLTDLRFSRAALTAPDAPRVTPIPMPPNALFTTDPPEHTRLRALVGRAFTARATERMRVRVRQLTAELLDGIEAAGQPADLIESFVFPLPVAFICELLGVPYADRDQLRAWSDRIFAIGDFPEEEVLTAYQGIGTYLDGLLDAKREKPADDMLSTLVTVQDEQGFLDQGDLIVLAMTLLMVGYPTTVDTLSCSLLMLLSHPEQYARLHTDPELIAPAVEELLRLNPPSSNLSDLRIAVADVEIGGTVIPAGSGVIPCYTSANRDETQFADPERFDIDRGGVGHIALGHGPHYCLGAALARVELQEALRGLVNRFPHLRLADPPEQLPWRESMFGIEIKELRVTW